MKYDCLTPYNDTLNFRRNKSLTYSREKQWKKFIIADMSPCSCTNTKI